MNSRFASVKRSRRKLLGGLAALGTLGFAGTRSQLWQGIRFPWSPHRVMGAESAPPSDPPQTFAQVPSIRCFAIGDWGTGSESQRQVARSMKRVALAERPQFVLSTGDNFYPSGITSVRAAAWRDTWSEIYNGPGLEIPWFAALGNHDHQSAIQPQLDYHQINPRWNLPAAYYSFVRREGGTSAEFFILDTDSIIHGSPDEVAAQMDWFDSALAASTADWKLCIGHHPLRSNGKYGCTPQIVEHVAPRLNRFGANAYLCGHDHDLQLVQHPADCFWCIVTGAGGKSRDTGYGPGSLYAATNGGFAYLAITAEQMHVAFADAAGIVRFTKSCPGAAADSPARNRSSDT